MCTSSKIRKLIQRYYMQYFCDIVAGISTMESLVEISWYFVQQLVCKLFAHRFQKKKWTCRTLDSSYTFVSNNYGIA